mgnify:CR=1 FL=1
MIKPEECVKLPINDIRDSSSERVGVAGKISHLLFDQFSQLFEKLKACSHQLIADIIDALFASLVSDEAQVFKGCSDR